MRVCVTGFPRLCSNTATVFALVLSVSKTHGSSSRRENQVPIFIDGLMDGFGSGKLHKFRNVLECISWNKEKEGQDEQHRMSH